MSRLDSVLEYTSNETRLPYKYLLESSLIEFSVDGYEPIILARMNNGSHVTWDGVLHTNMCLWNALAYLVRPVTRDGRRRSQDEAAICLKRRTRVYAKRRYDNHTEGDDIDIKAAVAITGFTIAVAYGDRQNGSLFSVFANGAPDANKTVFLHCQNNIHYEPYERPEELWRMMDERG